MNTLRPKQAYKSSEDKILTGVCDGLAEYFDTDPLVIRLLFIFLTLANGLGLIIYIMLSLILPTDEELIAKQDEEFFEHVVNGIPDPNTSAPPASHDTGDDLIVRENILAMGLILMGAFVLQMDVVPWSLIPAVAQIPVLIIVVGFAFIVKSTNTK